jgi:hypothetical protein
MVEQFAEKMGRDPQGPLIWAWLDREHLDQNLHRIRKHDDEHLVELRVPVSEMLLSSRKGWQVLLMDVQQAVCDAMLLNVDMAITAEQQLKWRAKVLDIPMSESTSRLQGSIDRIEPQWVAGITRLGPITQGNPRPGDAMEAPCGVEPL